MFMFGLRKEMLNSWSGRHYRRFVYINENDCIVHKTVSIKPSAPPTDTTKSLQKKSL